MVNVEEGRLLHNIKKGSIDAGKKMKHKKSLKKRARDLPY